MTQNRRGTEYRQQHPYPENIFWVIEYSASSLTTDREIKSKRYAEAEIPEYWMIEHLTKSRVIVFRQPKDGQYQSEEQVESETVCPLAFPSVAVAVRHLL